MSIQREAEALVAEQWGDAETVQALLSIIIRQTMVLAQHVKTVQDLEKKPRKIDDAKRLEAFTAAEAALADIDLHLKEIKPQMLAFCESRIPILGVMLRHVETLRKWINAARNKANGIECKKMGGGSA